MPKAGEAALLQGWQAVEKTTGSWEPGAGVSELNQAVVSQMNVQSLYSKLYKAAGTIRLCSEEEGHQEGISPCHAPLPGSRGGRGDLRGCWYQAEGQLTKAKKKKPLVLSSYCCCLG